MLLFDEVSGKDGVEGTVEAGSEVLVFGDGVEGNDADAAVLLVLFLGGVSGLFRVVVSYVIRTTHNSQLTS